MYDDKKYITTKHCAIRLMERFPKTVKNPQDISVGEVKLLVLDLIDKSKIINFPKNDVEFMGYIHSKHGYNSRYEFRHNLEYDILFVIREPLDSSNKVIVTCLHPYNDRFRSRRSLVSKKSRKKEPKKDCIETFGTLELSDLNIDGWCNPKDPCRDPNALPVNNDIMSQKERLEIRKQEQEQEQRERKQKQLDDLYSDIKVYFGNDLTNTCVQRIIDEIKAHIADGRAKKVRHISSRQSIYAIDINNKHIFVYYTTRKRRQMIKKVSLTLDEISLAIEEST